MKIRFSGKKLVRMKGYFNLYMDSVIPKEFIKTKKCQSDIKESLKSLNFKKQDSDSYYIILFVENIINVFVIRKMSHYRKIAKAFNVSDIVFVHNYLTHHTGTGKIMFPPGSFDSAKEIYSDKISKN